MFFIDFQNTVKIGLHTATFPYAQWGTHVYVYIYIYVYVYVYKKWSIFHMYIFIANVKLPEGVP